MKSFLLSVLCLVVSLSCFADKVYTPSSNASILGTSTYCQNATATVLTYTYNTCNVGAGTNVGTDLTITWYSNTVNSTTGGSVESITFEPSSVGSTGSTTFLPSTTTVGTMYYYCVITWDGTGACNTSGSLTSAVTSVTVNTAPDAITGTLSGCVGTVTTLSNTVGGGTWTSATPAKATINSGGGVGAVSAGTSVISYSIGSCRSTATFTIYANPAAITGGNTICEGATTTFANTVAGGTWSVTDPTYATITGSGSSVTITGIAAGSTTVSYTIGGMCAVGRTITVNTTPTAITGTLNSCAGVLTTLSSTPSGGTWTSATLAKATITSGGVVSAVSAGTSIISYTIGSCRATATFTVNTTPAAIAGGNTICEGATTTFTNSVGGGTWSIVDPTKATITASGSTVTITGVAAGSTIVSYTIGSCAVGRTITVNTMPTAITGTFNSCAGVLTTLSSTPSGGTWTSATVAKATITSGGVVSAVSAGTSVISYTIGSCRATATFTVNTTPAAITGGNTICEGATTTFGNTVAGGTWSIVDPAVATLTVSGSTVTITGIAAGSTTISYTIGTCAVGRSITVNTQPTAITGTFDACVGVLTTLSSTPSGGTWASSAPTKASINSSGRVTAIAAGTAVISYTIGSCRSTATFTVNATPAAITGGNTICEGATTTFGNTVAGGTWSIVDPAVATITASGSTVTITGIAAGNTIVSYTIGTCAVGRSITVNTQPTAITGTFDACIGVLTTLSSTPSGGTWTSANTSKATITSGGVVSPVSAGTSAISYSIGSCRSTATFTVNATPAAITGGNTICEGATTTFGNTVAGGTWSIVDPAVATLTVSGSTVTITGIAAGSSIVSYTIGTCAVGRTITVNTQPTAIAGTLNACVGTLTTLSSTPSGGTWTSATVAKATITSGGVVSAVSAGTSVISYSIGSCRSTATFTVNSTPNAITGTQTICEGATTTFANTVAGGTWSVADPAYATITASGSSVTITGVAAGSTIISYAIGTCAVGRTITINPMPTAIAGNLDACVGSLTTLSSTPSGGTWVSATTARATINSSGVVTPVSAGTSVISYTLSGCRVTTTFTINTTPAAITGTQAICENTATTFANTVAGGTWSIADPAYATITASGTSVTISGIAEGSTLISYSIGTCAVGRSITVNTTPTAITGNTNACVGVLTTLSSSPSGGTWTSVTTAKATITSGGVVTPVSAGTSVISYTIGSCKAIMTFTTNATPAAIAGTNTICNYATTTFSNSVAGGTWSTDDPSIATINASSPVTITGVSDGSTAISYTIGTCAVGRSITINAAPTPIAGTTNSCIGILTTLSSSPGSGTWASSNVTRATVTSGGVVTAVSAGTASISYSIGTCRSIVTFTINPNPAAITGTNTICGGAITTFTDATAGGSWTSGNTAIATVDGSNPVGITGVGTGSTFITYTLPTSCYATRGITISPTPDPISGASGVCLGLQTTLSNGVGGGTWSSSAPTVATITSGGVVTGLTANPATISYTIGSCRVTLPFSVNANPAAITGTASVCEGAITTLSNATGGGSWSSNSSSIATVDGSDPVGVTGVLAGTTTISYTLPTSCFATRTLTVNTQPVAITGTMYVCEGAVTTLSDLSGGGTWSSSNNAIATVNPSSGAVTGVLAGNANISYTLGSCYTTAGFATLGIPGPIDGASTICAGASTTFTTSGIMGTWSSNDPSIATVNASGIVTGLSAGSTTITYSNGCGTPVVKAIDVHTVPDMPAVITGTFTFCTGTVSTLADATPLGTWSSSNTDVATITTDGVVTGVAAGSSAISYGLTNECGTTAATQTITIVNYPTAVISSAVNPCMNYSSNIVFTGTPGVSIVYNIDGGSNVTETLTGGTFILGTGNLSATHVYQLVEVHNATCTTNYDTIATLVPIPMQWVGGTFGHEGEWERASNWSCGFVPGDTTDVIIPSGTEYSPLVSATRVVYARNLTIATGATVYVDADAYLYVKGALSNGGTFNGEGNLSLLGTAAQAITGFGNVSNFELRNSAGAAINTGSRMTIIKSITMTTGTLTTNDSLVLASDASATARVAPITFGSSISGNVRVMQYIPGGYRRYRFWSHPFTTTISLSQLQPYMDITGQGGSANGFTTTASNNPSCFRYNPLVGNSALGTDPGWKPFTKINSSAADSNTFHRYQGLRLFFRGVKGQGLGYVTDIVDPNTVGMVGPLNQGEQIVHLAKGAGANQDYNMVGNPYASPVDIGTVCYNAKTDGKVVGPAFYVWDPFMGTSGQFRTITIGVGAASPYYLQANTSFQIRVANNGDALTFNESNKGVAPTHNLLKSSPDAVSLVIYDGEYHPWDMLSVKFNESATANEDNDLDAQKLQGGDLNFYSLSADGQKLAIDARPFSGESVVPLGFNTQFNKEYIIKSESVVTPGNNPLYLHDKLKGKYVLLQQGTEYRFTVDNNIATQGDQRFELSMKPGAVSATTSISLQPNPATDEVNISYSGAKEENVSVRILDVTGVCVYNKNCGVMQVGTIKVSLKDLSSGIYMVEIASGNNRSVHRLVKE